MVMPRRRPLPWPDRIRGWLWPRSGWRRAGSYLVKRIHRLPGSPHSIAAGLACGVAVSFLPLIGLHLLGALALAWLLRGSLLAAAIGSLVGNPWTLPLMLASDYRLGTFMLGWPQLRLAGLSWEGVAEDFWLVFWPMLVGAVPLAVLTGLASYAVLRPLIGRVQERRRRRIARGPAIGDFDRQDVVEIHQ